jgi:hypothetical protein
MSTLSQRVASRFAATRKKPSKKAPVAPKGPPVTVDIYRIEQRALDRLRNYLGDTTGDLRRELKSVEGALVDARIDAEMDGREFKKEDETAVWDRRDTILSDVVTEGVSRALEYMAQDFETVAEHTRDSSLAKAVGAIRIPEYGEWPQKTRNEKGVEEVIKHLEKAQGLVPTELKGPGTLGKLRDALDEVVKAVEKATGKSLPEVKIPKAIERPDPRQLSMFTASVENQHHNQ